MAYLMVIGGFVLVALGMIDEGVACIFSGLAIRVLKYFFFDD